MAPFPFRSPAEFSAPRAIGVPTLRDAGAVVLCADAAANDLADVAGGVILLTVDRENADCDGRALAGVARAPSMLSRVGLAFTLPRAEAPLNWLEESFTELPPTDRPPTRFSRDMARPAVAAYWGNPPCAP